MNSFKLISQLKKYINFIPFYLVGSGCAFTIDLIVFTLLRTSLGSNMSAVIAFIFGTITSFLVLSNILEYRLRKKRIGIVIQLLIGLGTLLINIVVLNIIDYSSEKINYDTNTSNHHHFYNKEDGLLIDVSDKLKINGLPNPPIGKKIEKVEVLVNLKK